MEKLDMSLFISAAEDNEKAKYNIAGYLQKCLKAFRSNRIFPFFSNLLEYRRVIKVTLKSSADLEKKFPRPIRGVDLARKRIIYGDLPELSRREYVHMKDVMRWSLPHIETVIEEGKTVCAFVEETSSLDPVGILPRYLNEGYLIVPHDSRGALAIVHYRQEIYTDARAERHVVLSTDIVGEIPDLTTPWDPVAIKEEIVEQADFPNPPVFVGTTEINFPFDETVFPIMRQKLVEYIMRENKNA